MAMAVAVASACERGRVASARNTTFVQDFQGGVKQGRWKKEERTKKKRKKRQKRKQGWIHGIRCVLARTDSSFGQHGFNSCVMDGRTDGQTDQWVDGRTDEHTLL